MWGVPQTVPVAGYGQQQMAQFAAPAMVMPAQYGCGGCGAAQSWAQPQTQMQQLQQLQQQQTQQYQAQPGMQAAASSSAGAQRATAWNPGMGGEEKYVAFTEGSDANEFVIQTLAGEFLVKGMNHERPFYQKESARPGVPPPEVYLYYWDGRDGPGFQGWWFGKAVGGNEVWSHCPDSAKLPPASGWKIPFQGPVKHTFVVMPRSQKVRKDASDTKGKILADLLANKGKIKVYEERASSVISEAMKAIDQARLAAASTSLDAASAIKLADAQLTPKVEGLVEQLRQVNASDLGSLGIPIVTRLRQIHAQASAEQGKLKVALAKAIRAQQLQQLEVRDEALEKAMIAGVTEKFNVAEDLVEKAEITSAMIDHAGEDLAEAQRAAEQTEVSAQQAQVAVKNALTAIGMQFAALKRFETDGGRIKANDALAKLREKLREASQKLAPLMAAKAELATKAAAQELDVELSAMLAPVEAEVDKAEEVAAPLLVYAEAALAAKEAAVSATATAKAKPGPKPDKAKEELAKNAAKESKAPPSAEVVENAARLAAVAVTNLAYLAKVFEQRRVQAVCMSEREKKVFVQGEERIRTAQRRLDRIKTAQKEIRERETSSSLMAEVAQKMSAAEAAVKSAEAEVGAMGSKGATPGADEEAIKVAGKTLSAAKIAIAMRLLEVKRFTAEAGLEAQRHLQEQQTVLQAGVEKLEKLKATAAGQRKSARRKEAMYKVEQAEECARQTASAGAVVFDEAKVGSMSNSEIREAGDNTKKASQAALEAIEGAQRMITALQIEAKGSDVSAEVAAEVSKLQARLRAVESDVARFENLPQPVIQQLQMKEGIDEAEEKVKAAEAKVAVAERLAAEAEENPTPAAVPDDPVAMTSTEDSLEPTFEDGKGKGSREFEEGKGKGSREFIAPTAKRAVKPGGYGGYEPPVKGTVMKGKHLRGGKGFQQPPMRPPAGRLPVRQSPLAPEGPVDKARLAIDSATVQLKVSMRFVEAHARQGKLPEEEASPMRFRLEAGREKLELAAQAVQRGVEKKSVLELLGNIDSKVTLVEEAVEAAANMAAPLQELMAGGGPAEKEEVVEKDAQKEEQDDKVKDEQKDEQMEEQKDEVEQESSIVKEEASPKDTDGTVAAVALTTTPTTSPLEEALAAMNVAAQAASKLVSAVKTSIAVKRISATRLPGKASEACIEKLDELHKRVDVATRRLAEARRVSTDRRYAKARKVMASNTEQAEAKVKLAREASSALSDLAQDADPLEMQSVLQRSAQAQADADAAIATARSHLQDRLNECRADGATPDTSDVVSEFQEMLEQLNPLQEEINEQRQQANLREHKFVAMCLMQEATEMFAALDEKIKLMSEAAEPLVSGKGEDLLLQEHLGQLLDSLRRHASSTSKEAATLFKELAAASGGDGKIAPQGLPAALRSLKPELPELTALLGTTPEDEKLLVDSFARLASEAGSVAEEMFLDRLKARYMCVAVVSVTEKLEFQDSATVRKLELHEVLEALGEPVKEEQSGLVRVQIRAEKDGAEGYVSLAGTEGTTYLEAYTSFLACVRHAEDSLREVSESVVQTTAYLKQKSDELKSTRGAGPLSEVKSELMKLRVRASRAQTTHNDVKRKVSDAKKLYGVQLEAQRKRRQEAADKAVSESLTSEATALVERLMLQANAACQEAESLLSGGGSSVATGQEESPPSGVVSLAALKKVEEGLLAATDAASQGQELIMKRVMEEIRNATKGPLVEARRLMFRLKVKLAPLPASCKKQLVLVQARRATAEQDSQRVVAAALRSRARTALVDAGVANVGDALFDLLLSEASGADAETHRKAGVVPASSLRSFLRSGPSPLADDLLEEGLFGLEAGASRLCLQGLVQEYRRCVKEIALTSLFEVKGGSTVRKLEVEELVEVLEEPSRDAGTSLLRAKCRALRDQVEGWATLQGNQGTVFLETAAKPYLICEADTVLWKNCATTGEELRSLRLGEVFEVLEGPRQEADSEVTRALGKAAKDGAVGWVTLRDAAGQSSFELRKQMVCKGSVALTDSFDIGSCSAIRKLEIGEGMEPLEEPTQDEKRKLLRIKVRCAKDGKEGWVTAKGNQGTLYVEDSQVHYLCSQRVTLEGESSSSKALRTLEEGEHFELLKQPVKDVRKGLLLARCRGISSGKGEEGWLAVESAGLRPWSLRQKCLRSTKLQDLAAQAGAAQVIRELLAGEEVVALEAPTSLPSDLVARARVRACRDGAIGSVDLFDDNGQAVLRAASEGCPKT